MTIIVAEQKLETIRDKVQTIRGYLNHEILTEDRRKRIEELLDEIREETFMVPPEEESQSGWTPDQEAQVG